MLKVPVCHKNAGCYKSASLLQKCPLLQKCQFVTKVPCCFKSALFLYKSATLMLQKCPNDVTKVPHVTNVPYLRYKSSLSRYKSSLFSLQKCPCLWLSPSLSLILLVLFSIFFCVFSAQFRLHTVFVFLLALLLFSLSLFPFHIFEQ